MRPHEAHKHHAAPLRLGFAVVTVSDTRTPETDEGGRVVRALVEGAGHRVASYGIVPDEAGDIRALVERGLRDDGVDAVVLTGGTGVGPRDVTPEAVLPLLEKELPGFGEAFRALSFQEVGSPAYLSRAFAGVALGKPVFALPGSPGGVRLAMERLVLPECAHLRRIARG